MQAFPHEEFTDSDLETLENFTMEDHWLDHEGMPVEAMDGLLCAISVAQSRVGPAEFLAMIQGEVPGRIPENIAALIVKRWIDINGSFWGDAEYMYAPILLEAGDGEQWTSELQETFEAHYGQDWAYGFLDGMHLLEQDFGRAAEASETHDDTLLAILSLAEGNDLRSDDPENTPLRYDQRQAIVEQLPEQLMSMAEYFLEHPSEWRKQPLRVEKIGRNDACPCGSGKKYKQCCLKG